jgi:ABC-type glutathione transport system ATPase component
MLVEVINLYKQYETRDGRGNKRILEALKPTNLRFRERTGYSLVGESGSGKTTLARLLMGIEGPSGGEIWFGGENITHLRGKRLRLKRREFQMVTQNASGSLDPRLKIYNAIAEPLRCLTRAGRKAEGEKILDLAGKVRLSPDHLERLPHELSGGQQKRACIARALILSPRFIVFDEAVSGLDVTIRKQVLDLILRLFHEGLLNTFLFITHDIDVALYMAANIFVMKDGAVVEHIENAASYADFTHGYSKLLIESLPPRLPREGAGFCYKNSSNFNKEKNLC